MYILTQDTHRIVTSEKEYRYGRFIDIHQILERMTISLDEGSHCYRINARVNDQGQRHVLSMKINQLGEVIHYHCGCHFETSQSACRHCAAILFFLKKQDIDSFPYFYEKNNEAEKVYKYQLLEKQKQERILNKKHHESLSLIELYKDRLLRESMIPLSSQQYQLKVYTIKDNNQLEVTLKIVHGAHSFVIKNIATFLHAIEYHESLKYGKNFEFVHSRDAFDADSLEILAFVEEAFIKNQTIQKGIIKNLIIDKGMIDSFYDLMNALPSRYCDIGFETKKTFISLEIMEKEDSYVLDFKDYQGFDDMIMSYIHIYQFVDDVLYRYDLDQEGKCLILIQKLLESQGGLYIPKDSIAEFYRYILIDILEYINLETTLFDDYRQENMINLYADMTKDDQICIQLEYIYDDSIAYGFDEQNKQLSKEADVIENYLRPYIEDEDDHVIYLQYDHDFAYSFVKEGLPYLSNYCQIYVSDALKSLSTVQDIQIQIGVNISHNLLEINIDSIQIDKSELSDILKAYKKKRKFYKLKNGQLLSLESSELKELDELTRTLQLSAQDFNQEKMAIPTYRLFEVENLSNQQSHVAYLKTQTVQTFIEGFQNPKQYAVPVHYQNILREYQKKVMNGYVQCSIMVFQVF